MGSMVSCSAIGEAGIQTVAIDRGICRPGWTFHCYIGQGVLVHNYLEIKFKYDAI